MTQVPANPLLKPAAPEPEAEQTLKAAATRRMYRLHSAPGSFVFSSGRRVACPDGIIRADDDAEQAELDATAIAGNIYEVTVAEAEALAAQLSQEGSNNLSGIK